MISNSHWTHMAVVAGLTTLTGCHPDLLPPTMYDVKTLSRLEAERDKAHDDNMTEQHKAMSPEAAEAIDLLKRLYDDKFADIGRRTDAIEGKAAEALSQVARFGGELIGIPPTVTAAVTRRLTPKIDRANDKASSAIRETQSVARRLEVLDADINDKLANTSQDTFARLSELKDNEAEFRKLLRDELMLTPDEMEQLQGMTTNEILALIGATITAAGVGVAGGKSGKSRSQPEIEKVKEAVSRISAEIERMKPPIT